MGPLAWWVLAVAYLAVCILIGYGIHQTPTHPAPLAYCVDPFTSEELGQVVYTHCKLVPMWSMKV
jgi:hypothetical protein